MEPALPTDRPTSPPPRYLAEEGDVDALASTMTRLWAENLGSAAGDLDEKLDWYYRRAPTGPGRVVALRLRAGDGGAGPGEVVGCLGIGARRVYTGGTVERAALLADLVVDRPHRTLLPAMMLARGARAFAARGTDFQYGFPNQSAVGLFERIGYERLGNMARYVRVLRFAPYVARRLAHPSLARLAGAALDVAARVLDVPSWFRAAGGYRLDWPEAPDASFDRLFATARGQYPMIADRGREFLAWRFFSRLADRPRLCTLRRRLDGELGAYAVIHRVGDVAHLADFLASSAATQIALVRAVLPVLAAEGCTSVSVRYLGPSIVADVLGRCGFRLRDATRAVVFTAADGRPAPRGDFYLTDADEDN